MANEIRFEKVFDPSGNVELDTTLTKSGKAADAKAVGDRLAAIGNVGGGGSGGYSIKSVTFTNRASAWDWLKNNHPKVIKALARMTTMTGVAVFDQIGFEHDTNGNITKILLSSFWVSQESGVVKYHHRIGSISDSMTMFGVDSNFLKFDGAYYAEDEVAVTGQVWEMSPLPDEYWEFAGASLEVFYIE